MRGRLLLLLCVAASVLGVGRAGASSVVQMGCSAREPQALIPTTKGPPLLVRPSATAILLCRYRGLNPPASALRLRSSRLVTEKSEVASIVTALNGLPVAKGAFHCPMDDGSAILAHFSYSHGSTATVRIGLTGCRTVTGVYLPLRTAVSPGGTRLIAHLERLTP